jgi:hypothetical protein
MEDPDCKALLASLIKSKTNAMQTAGLPKLTEKELAHIAEEAKKLSE